MSEFTPSLDLRIVPPPPRLHWGVVLALQIVTLGLFQLVWFVVQAWWVKRMTGRNKAFVWALVNLCAVPVLFVIAVAIGIVLAATKNTVAAPDVSKGVDLIYRLIFIAVNLTTAFTLRSQLDSYPINMSLSGVMTFFFGAIYFQYHMNNYVLPDANEVFGEIPEAPVYVPPTLPQEPA